MVVAIVAVAVATEGVAWAATVVTILVIAELVEADLVVLVIFLRFLSSKSYSLAVPCGMDVDFSMIALIGVMLDVLAETNVDMSTGVNVNAFAVVMAALEFLVSIPSKEFGC